MISTSTELVKLVKSSIPSLPLSTTIKLASLTLFPWVKFVKIKLPLNLSLLCPVDEIIDVWYNILHIFYFKDYELITDFIPKNGWIVLDVGSYIGIWLLKAARLVGDNGLVVGFEPHPISFQIAYANVKINNFKNVILLNYAISERNSYMKLYVPNSRINCSLLEEYVNLVDECRQIVNVKTVRLDYVLRKLRINRVDLLKIDVEGYELRVLKSIENLLYRKVIKRLIIEVHTNVVNIHEIANYLEELGWDTIVNFVELPYQAFIYAK